MTLTDFLLARITEDEVASRAWGCDCDLPGLPLQHGLACRVRVLAECEAKRRIVGIHQVEKDTGWLSGEPNDWLWCTRCGSTDDRPVAFPCDTLLALALPYADHPDYQQKWAP